MTSTPLGKYTCKCCGITTSMENYYRKVLEADKTFPNNKIPAFLRFRRNLIEARSKSLSVGESNQ